MRFFSFNGLSCATVIGSQNPLILVSFDDDIDEIPGSSKEVITGDTSIYKTIANEYGNKYANTLTFEYGLMKASGEMITSSEQEAIETWLTSPKLSQYLQLYDVECDENGEFIVDESATPVAIYCGTFTETSWIAYDDGYMGAKFSFQCDQPYAWSFHSIDLSDIEDGASEVLNIVSDATEDFIYPKITLTAVNSRTPTEEISISITNETDDSSTLTLTTLSHLVVNIDCWKLRITDNAGNIINYDDLGWSDVGNIYWPRFVNGNNTLSFSLPEDVTLDMSISYMSTKKIVGGWL